MFDLNIALIAQEKTTGDYEIFQPVRDENFPPARKDIEPRILHIGDETIKNSMKSSKNFQSRLLQIKNRISRLKVPKPLGKNLQSQLLRIEKRVSQLKVPKPPSKNLQSQLPRVENRISRSKMPTAPSPSSSNA
ncbi:hypothetical protein F5Y07DRAFT_413564 [Xylaria sp. FL0933]|nr:hypothetical protein F5Y07DRAFT_413564 [Xylaria sp. FL0933]